MSYPPMLPAMMRRSGRELSTDESIHWLWNFVWNSFLSFVRAHA